MYRFEYAKAANGVALYTIRTTPDNVRLRTIDSNVTATPYFGVNGGFFWEGALLSIAVENGRPLKGEPGDYGSGCYNTGVDSNLRRGTLVWDEAARRFSVQVVTDASELQVTDKLRYWAQGGVSMGLSNETGWEREMIAEQMPAYDEGHSRTALVYDRDNRLYMIVTPTLCTIEQFRTAIREKIGGGRLADGVFLDGDGSSQLQVDHVRLAGDRRQVYQMLALIR
ncbi:hypothetical protein SD70_27635 [Gordoniibacillus kamchatkensis]|uniref:Phosphodiester glycosidase domain-containing protein n=1 Tax=Gordoniibacillus kamchatkensis TaxID=1590651 RepID=A0ABR5ABP4_9BACL|nr:hypothetical protein SD70_27635 [Paenibacillus sp. VKM B-2647]